MNAENLTKECAHLRTELETVRSWGSRMHDEVERQAKLAMEARQERDSLKRQLKKCLDDRAGDLRAAISFQRERDELKQQLEKEFGCLKCGDGNTPLYCLNCANDKLKSERDTAQACCAEMRECLSRWEHYMTPIGQTTWAETFNTQWLMRVKHALSSSCGKDFIHRDKVKPLVEAARAACDWFETGPADFSIAAEKLVPDLESALTHAKEIGL